MLWLARGCLVLGLFPNQVIAMIDPVTRPAGVRRAGRDRGRQSGWLLVPVAMERASYAPALFLLGILASFALAYLLVRRLYHARMRRAPPWDCGYPWQSARMQDTAEGFGQPIRQIFEPMFRMKRELPTAFRRRSLATGSPSRIRCGIGSICRLPLALSVCPEWSPCCSGGELRSICCTASSP